MPAPANSEELLDFVTRSGVVEETRLRAYVARLREQPGGIPEKPSDLATVFIRDGLITSFQADHLLQGKWKRFFLGKYKVLEKLGTGGMGTVFLCEHKLMKRRVAVKVLPASKAQDEAALQRFYREARAVAAVDHPNLVRAYDIDEDEGLHFLVMEYVDGINLQDLVKKFGPLDIHRACHYIFGAAVGLHHASEMGLVHRDIKPANILVERTGVVKILDMGLARFFHPEEDDLLTKKFDENVLGTADYLAPEQAIDSSTVDIRADIYGLGGTFYFLLAGQPPFPEGTVAQKLLWHQTKTPRPVKDIRPEVPEAIDAIVTRMLAKDVRERVQSPEELISLLSAWVQTPIAPPPDREMPQLSPAAQVLANSSNRVPGISATSAGLTFNQPGAIGPVSAAGKPRSDSLRGDAITSEVNPPVEPQVQVRPAASLSPPAAFTPPYGPSRQVPRSGAFPTVTPAQVGAATIPKTATDVPAGPPGPLTPLGGGPEFMFRDSAVGADTMENAQTDTSRNAPDDPPAAVPRRKPPKSQVKKKTEKKKTPWALFIGGGLFLLLITGLGVGLALYYRNTGGRTEPTSANTNKERDPVRWMVSSTGAGDPKMTRKTIADAIRDAQPGDTIAIVDAELASTPIVVLNKKNLRIEPASPTGTVKLTYKPESTGGRRNSMFEINTVEDFVMNRLVIDLGGALENGVAVAGQCADVKIENLTVLNPKSNGFVFQNVAGEENRPVQLIRFRVSGRKYENGVVLNSTAASLQSKNIRISHGRVNGAKDGVRVLGASTDVRISQCRFFNLEVGVHIAGKQDGDIDLSVDHTTFADIRVAGVMADAGIGGLKQSLKLDNNYFASTKELVRSGGVSSSVKAVDNARDAASNEGNVVINSTPATGLASLNQQPDSPEFLKPTPPNRGAE